MATEIVLAILQIFGVFFIGWLARHLKYIEETELNRWSRFVVDFLFPVLVFHSIVKGLEVERLREFWPLPLLGLGMISFGALCGIPLRAGVRSKDIEVRRTFHHICAINNYGYLPIIIVQNLWGDVGLAKLFLLNVGSSVGYWTIGVGLLGEWHLQRTARHIVSPNLVGLAVALLLSVSGASRHLPETLLRITGSVGSAAVPCMLILIGASLYPFPSLRDMRDLGYLSFVRLILLPFLTICILRWLPLGSDVRNIALIVALMPATISSTIITRRFGGAPDFAARAAVLTTLLSIATIPIALMMLSRVLGWR